MSFQYVDASVQTGVSAKKLAAAGVKAIGRYYNYGAGNKVLNRLEAQALIDSGIAIWVVFEFNNNSPKWFSADLGQRDALRAMKCAKEIIGQPEGSCIYFAADYDETGRNYATKIVPYFEAVRKVFKRKNGSMPYRIGVYSNGLVCRKLLEDGLVTETWLSCSTGFVEHAEFLASNNWSIAQTCGVPAVAGVDVDSDKVRPADFGQFDTLVPLAPSHAAVAAAMLHSEFLDAANAAEKLEQGAG